MEKIDKFAPHALSLLRFVSGFLMLFHGTQKLLNYPPKPDFKMAEGIMFAGGLIELFGGAMLAAGLFTRWTAFVLSGLMAVAYFGWHASGGFLPIVNRGELAAIYSFVYLYLFFAGGGPVSIDALLNGKRGTAG